MDNRYKMHVINANIGKLILTLSGTEGKFIPREINIFPVNNLLNLPNVSAGKCAKKLSVYTDTSGNQAVVPPGWTVSKLETENTIWGKNLGLVIYRIPAKYAKNIDWNNLEEIQSQFDQFVYVPINLLDAKCTQNGIAFGEKFGRINYREDAFSGRDYHELPDAELVLQVESIKKYGGFYISRYNVSNRNGKPRSVKGAIPWVNIDFNTAKLKASKFRNNATTKSHLVFGSEYDSVLSWIEKVESKTLEEIRDDSTTWGNYGISRGKTSKNNPTSWENYGLHQKKNFRIAKTGSSGSYCVNNIYDLAGNINEWTQERYGKDYCVLRGGSFKDAGFFYPAAYRDYEFPTDSNSATGFRASLLIK